MFFFNAEGGHDFFEIYDGYSTSSGRIGGYSGFRTDFYFVSSGKDLVIKFTTDAATTYTGFSLNYNTTLDPGTFSIFVIYFGNDCIA